MKNSKGKSTEYRIKLMMKQGFFDIHQTIYIDDKTGNFNGNGQLLIDGNIKIIEKKFDDVYILEEGRKISLCEIWDRVKLKKLIPEQLYCDKLKKHGMKRILEDSNFFINILPEYPAGNIIQVESILKKKLISKRRKLLEQTFFLLLIPIQSNDELDKNLKDFDQSKYFFLEGENNCLLEDDMMSHFIKEKIPKHSFIKNVIDDLEKYIGELKIKTANKTNEEGELNEFFEDVIKNLKITGKENSVELFKDSSTYIFVFKNWEMENKKDIYYTNLLNEINQINKLPQFVKDMIKKSPILPPKHLPNIRLTEDKFAKEITIHEPQYKISEQLKAKMFPTSIINEFENFDFFILLPPFNSLEKQTKERVTCFFIKELFSDDLELLKKVTTTKNKGHYISDRKRRNLREDNYHESWTKIDNLLDLMNTRIFKSTIKKNGAKEDKIWPFIVDSIENNKKTLHLIIHDECHYGINSKGMVDKIINDEKLCGKNVYFLHVSATSWNISNLSNVKVNVVEWKEIPNEYKGFEWYKNQNNNYVKEDEEVIDTHSLMMSYAIAFLRKFDGKLVENKPVNKLSEEIVERIVNSPKEHDMIVIRVERDTMEAASKILYQLRNMISSNYPQADSWKIVTKSNEYSEIMIEELEKLNKGRILLLVIESARMGDTLPPFSYFDIRARYNSDSSAFSTFLQDIGRCFGYRHPPPFIFLNSGGKRMMEGQMKRVDQYVRLAQDQDKEIDNLLEELFENNNHFLHFCNGKEGESKHMWDQFKSQKLQDHIKNNRFVLKAYPQIGKTGTYLSLLRLLMNNIIWQNQTIFEVFNPKSLVEWHKVVKQMTPKNLIQYWSKGDNSKNYFLFNDQFNAPDTLLTKFNNGISFKGKSVLDLGCGENAMLLSGILKRKIKLKSYVGVDCISKEPQFCIDYNNNDNNENKFPCQVVPKTNYHEWVSLNKMDKKFDIFVFCRTLSWGFDRKKLKILLKNIQDMATDKNFKIYFMEIHYSDPQKDFLWKNIDNNLTGEKFNHINKSHKSSETLLWDIREYTLE